MTAGASPATYSRCLAPGPPLRRAVRAAARIGSPVRSGCRGPGIDGRAASNAATRLERDPKRHFDVPRPRLLAGELAEVRVRDVGDQTADPWRLKGLMKVPRSSTYRCLAELESLLDPDVFRDGIPVANRRQIRSQRT